MTHDGSTITASGCAGTLVQDVLQTISTRKHHGIDHTTGAVTGHVSRSKFIPSMRPAPSARGDRHPRRDLANVEGYVHDTLPTAPAPVS